MVSYNDDGECKQDCNGKEHHIFSHHGKSKHQCNEQEHLICFQSYFLSRAATTLVIR